MRISVLDMGSTTFHAQVFEVDGSGRFQSGASDRRALHLGRDVYATGRIGEAKWQEALTAVGEMVEATRTGAKDVTIAVATSVLRDAANGLAFRVEVMNRYRLGVQLLTPEQEARFTYLGATTTPNVGGRRVAVIDLGGGSLEIAVGEGTRCLLAGSLPLGALAVRARLGHVGTLGATELGHVHEMVRETGRELFSEARSLSPEVVVFASGTARRACDSLMQHCGVSGAGDELQSAALHHAVAQLTQSATVDEASLVSGSIMLASLDLMHADRAIISRRGLRDGVALDVYRQVAREAAARAPVRLWNRRLADLAKRVGEA